MGLLNHLFGDEKDIAEELVMDDDRRMALWQQQLTNLSELERLSKHFSFENVNKALQDFNATEKVLNRIESLISSDFISISNEEKLDEEILADLKRLRDSLDIREITKNMMYERKKQAALFILFRELHDNLKTMLHLIRLIRKKPDNMKDLLLKLFKLIFLNLPALYKPFIEDECVEEDKITHAKISRLAKAVILQQKLEEEIITEKERFANEMYRQMSTREWDEDKDEPKSQYRRLAESIFLVFTERIGAPLSREADWDKAINMLHNLIKDDKEMYKVVKKLRPKYNDMKIRAVIQAFRKAHENEHFEELYSEFAT